MIVSVERASDPKYWYATEVGKVFEVIVKGGTEYVVRDSEGYLNIIKTEDAKEINDVS
jgi:hypothetical protein